MKNQLSELEKRLFDNDIYDAWQYVINTNKSIEIARYCKLIVSCIIENTSKEYSEWLANLKRELISEENKTHEVLITSDNLPRNIVRVVNRDIDSKFLLDKLVKDFFQYLCNAFDTMSQAANVALLANKSIKIDTVDFPKMKGKFSQKTYSNDFPQMAAWFESTNDSEEYQYLQAINNRTKHTLDVNLKLATDIFCATTSSKIGKFFRREVSHEEKETVVLLNETLSFVEKCFGNFINILDVECCKKLYVNDRYHKINVYQQKTISNPDADYAVFFLESLKEFEDMPDEIRVLLLAQEETGKILSRNCYADTILIKRPDKEHGYIGRYQAVDACGDDTLIQYRKYKKDTASDGMTAYFRAVDDWRKNPKFYHYNKFMVVHAISDDEEFLKKIQCLF